EVGICSSRNRKDGQRRARARKCGSLRNRRSRITNQARRILRQRNGEALADEERCRLAIFGAQQNSPAGMYRRKKIGKRGGGSRQRVEEGRLAAAEGQHRWNR